MVKDSSLTQTCEAIGRSFFSKLNALFISASRTAASSSAWAYARYAMPKERPRIKGNSTNGSFVLIISFCIGHAPFGIRLFKAVSNPLGLDLKDHHQSTAAILFDVVVCRMVRYMAMKQPFARKPRVPNHVVALSRSDVD